MPHTALLTVQCDDLLEAEALARALAVEAADPLPGARATIQRDVAAGFAIHIEAADLAHLRAATNSYLKWLGAAHGALEKSRKE